jgi:hypothetical protein
MQLRKIEAVTKEMAFHLLKSTASNLGRVRSSIEWKAFGQFTTANRVRTA